MNLIMMLLFIICWFVLNIYKLKYFLHMMQLESYDNNKYMRWTDAYSDKVYTKTDKYTTVCGILLSAVFLLLSVTNKSKLSALFILIMGIAVIIDVICKVKQKYEAKKPLVFTERAKRLFVMSIAVLVADFVITFGVIHIVTKNIVLYLPLCGGLLIIMSYFSSYYMMLANYLVKPIERKINNRFYDMAANKIRNMNDLISVGITGSYGKTSTKFITATILEEKYKVLKTPESYNTPMGISKVINNDLTDEYNVFVAELGADQVGEIDEVAVLTNPKIGLITSIGPCHLESFGSIDNIMRTKYELIDRLPADGIAIFNYDNEHVKKLADKTFKEKILYGVENIEDTDIFAADIKVNKMGSVFTLCDKELGTVECKTKLLGKHNISNLLAGAAIAKVLGLTQKQIADGISKVEPVEHRLQLIDSGNGILVIDDAFNSNPDGAQAALDVMAAFKESRKIIVTPGMIELGELETIENQKFGEKIAGVCDIAILIGKKRTAPIQNGLKEQFFNTENMYVLNTLDEATKILAGLTKAGDIVLFENDLPDNYNEE